MLELNIEERDNIVYISVINQTKFGTDFNNGYFYFRASNGFMLHCTGARLITGIRLAKLYISAVDNNDPTVVQVPLTCGENRYYIKGLYEAIDEYNNNSI